MMFLLSIGFGAGVAAFVYSKMARRVGASDPKTLWTIVGVVFVLTTIIFATLLALLGIH